MPRQRGHASCPRCSVDFEYLLVHAGFNVCAYAYCDRCGLPTLLSPWSPRRPTSVSLEPYQGIARSVERHLRPCECGGRFRAGAPPRCPGCHEPLPADGMAGPIEEDAPATRDGWRWDRRWDGLYCVIINGRWIDDNWA